jgi:hypothetical protein
MNGQTNVENHICLYCGATFPNDSSRDIHTCPRKQIAERSAVMQKQEQINNVMPEGQGHRDANRPRYDLIPLLWKQMLAEIFEEGLPKYGDAWKLGGKDFLLDCLNHAEHHLSLFFDNDYSEKQLEKVAWNCLAVAHHLREHPELREFFSTRKMKQNASTPKIPKGE